jgi:hypothetical protein
MFIHYMFTNQSKLKNNPYTTMSENYINKPAGTVLEQWRRVAPSATATGGAWVHAPPPMKATKPVYRERLPLLCLPIPAVTYKTTENTTGS